MASVRKREWITPKGKERVAYEVRYKDGDAHRARTFPMKKAADAFKRKVENEIEAETHIAKTVAKTVKEVCEMFLRDVDDRLADGRISQNWAKTLRNSITNHVIPAVGHVLVKDMTWNDAEQFVQILRKKRLAGRSIKKHAGALKLVEDFAFKRGLTKKQVVALANQELRGMPVGKVRIFKATQAAMLFKAVEERPSGCKHRPQLMLKVMIHLAAFCGLRYGEITGLTWGCVDLDSRLLLIRHSLTSWGELKGPKTRAGVRDVPMPPHVVNLLVEWRQRFRTENERDLVFLLASGRSPQASEFHKGLWKPVLERAGLWKPGEDAYHFHALRHFAASFFVDMGMSLPRVASVLGHSTFDMTLQVYAHDIRGGDRQHDVVDEMAGRLLPPPSVTHGVRMLT